MSAWGMGERNPRRRGLDEVEKMVAEAQATGPELKPWIIAPEPHQEVSSVYDLIGDPARPSSVKMFRVVYPRRTFETDVQWQALRRSTQQFYYNLSLMRDIAHRICNALGLPKTCRNRRCRRARHCIADRNPHDWEFPGPWMPPCVRTDAMVDVVRKVMHRELRAALDAHAAKGRDIER